jgi:hypothetical protein
MKQAKNAMTSAANMKRAERFNLGNHGPALTAKEEQEAKKRRLQSAAKQLEISFGFDDFKVVPSLDLLKPATTQDLAKLPKTYRDLSSMQVPSTLHRSPSDVGDENLYKHVIKNYVEKGMLQGGTQSWMTLLTDWRERSATTPEGKNRRDIQ